MEFPDLIISKDDDTRAKKWIPKVLFLRTNYVRCFTTIVSDSITIYSTCTGVPSAGQEGFTRLISQNLYNDLYNHLILL